MSPLTVPAPAALLAVAGGALAAAVLAPPGPPPRGRGPAGSRAWPRTGAARRHPRWLLGGGVLVAVTAGPMWALTGWLAWEARAALQRHQQRTRHQIAIVDELPDVVDLLRLGIGAGLSMSQAVVLVAGRSAGPVRAALRSAHAAACAGRPLGDSLEARLGPLGDGPAGLANVLADHLRYGTPIDPELRRFAVEARTARRHRAEQAARRVPVRLLLPLVTCVLPAFALLTVVPLLAGSLQHLLV